MVRGVAAACLMGCVGGVASAELQGRYLTADTSHGFDAYYDTIQNVTWLADATYGGRKNWDDAEAWLQTLRLGGYRDWRFPTYANASGNGTTGELYQLWVVQLGNNADAQHPTMSYNPGPFHNVEYYMNSGAYAPTAAYWTGKSYGDFAMAWMTFNAAYIGQYRNGLSNGYGVWVCRTGDSGWAPPPCDGAAVNAQAGDAVVCGTGAASVVLSIGATGTGVLTYQWTHDGVPIDAGVNPSAATADLQLDGVRWWDAGMYVCEVSNACGSATSDPAWVTVCVADVNCDTVVDLADFFGFFNDFDQSLPGADVDQSGEVDLGDFFAFFNAFDASC